MDQTRCLIEFSAGTLVARVPERVAPRRPTDDPFWQWDLRDGVWRCDAMHYRQVLQCMAQPTVGIAQDFHMASTVATWRRIDWPEHRLVSLRAEQRDAVSAWTATRTGCVVMPTGTGKTEVALAAIDACSVSTLVVAPVRDLMYQWHRRIYDRLGYDAGVVGDQLFQVRPVCVTTYDSACIHMARLGNQFGLIVFDECHHLPGPVRGDAARMAAAPWRLGLTATWPTDAQRQSDLETLIGPVCYDLPLERVRGKTVADYEVIRIPVHLSEIERHRYDHLSAEIRRYVQRRRDEDPRFRWETLCAESASDSDARRMLRCFREKQAIEDRAEEKLRVLEDLFRLHVGEPALVFTGSNAMARAVALRFLIPCLLSHCGKLERREVLEGLEQGRYPALVANRVLDEGVDLPEVKVAIVVGGSGSTRQAKQRLGRILRKSGNDRAILYEVVTADTNEQSKSRRRRKSDAYQRARHRRV